VPMVIFIIFQGACSNISGPLISEEAIVITRVGRIRVQRKNVSWGGSTATGSDVQLPQSKMVGFQYERILRKGNSSGYSGCHKYVPFARFPNRSKCNV
jgi:nucleoid DNA-binding protein